MKGKKTGGRDSGTPNKITKELRELINDFLNENIGKVRTDFNKLEPKDRVRLFIDLLQYSIPKIHSISASIESYQPPTEIRLIRADGKVFGNISNSEQEISE